MNEESYDTLTDLFYAEPVMALRLYEADGDIEETNDIIDMWASTPDFAWNEALISATIELTISEIYTIAQDFVYNRDEGCCEEDYYDYDHWVDVTYVHIPVYVGTDTSNECCCSEPEEDSDPLFARWDREYSTAL